MGEKIVNYGIIGVGLMGREHLLNLYHLRIQNVAVVCIADPHLPSQQHAVDLATSFNRPLKVPHIIDNAYVIVEFENSSQGMLDLCMFAEGSKNEQEISVVGDTDTKGCIMVLAIWSTSTFCP